VTPATGQFLDNRRYWTIVGLAVLLNMVSYFDRVSLAVAAPGIRSEFHLTPVQLGTVFSVFSLSYALMQPAWGALADRYGARWIVALAITGWSLFTGLTAVATTYWVLVAMRLVFGAWEAGLPPSIASGFSRWIAPEQRSKAFGLFAGGGRLGGTIAPVIAAALVARFGWRASFVAFAGLGVIAGAAWLKAIDFAGVAKAPAPIVAAAVAPSPAVRYRDLLLSRRLICLLLVSFGYTFMWQFYATWFPTYLTERRGFTLAQAAAYAGLPFLLGLVANAVGGFLAEIVGRGRLGLCCLLASAALLFAGIVSPEARTAGLLIALAAGAGDLLLGAAWASAVDIGGKAGGAIAGLMNSTSALGGFVSPLLMGWVLQNWQSWESVLFMAVAANVISAVLWLGVNPIGTSRQRSAVATTAS
jgi:MFS family permease